MIWLVIWVVLMILWIFFGGYTLWDPARPAVLANVLIPWLCVLILGMVIFGGLPIDRPVIR